MGILSKWPHHMLSSLLPSFLPLILPSILPPSLHASLPSSALAWCPSAFLSFLPSGLRALGPPAGPGNRELVCRCSEREGHTRPWPSAGEVGAWRPGRCEGLSPEGAARGRWRRGGGRPLSGGRAALGGGGVRAGWPPLPTEDPPSRIFLDTGQGTNNTE